MSEPYTIIDSADSPSGKAMVIRGEAFPLSPQGDLSDAEWAAKLQAKADSFAANIAAR